MTEEIFSKIELKYDNECILNIINDKIYIFNNEGKFLYKSKDKINNNQTIKNYALTSIGLYNDIYKYAIGYFDDNGYLNLLLYNYNIKENNNILLNITKDYHYYTEEGDNGEYRNYTKGNKELSCEYMSTKFHTYIIISGNDNYRYILICFFFKGDQIKTTNYIIYNNKLTYTSSIPSVFSYFLGDHNDHGPTFIKSEINFNRSLIFVWYHFSSEHRTYFTTYNASSN